MKSDEEVIDILRSSKGKLTPVELAELLNNIGIEGLTQGTLVTYFKRAFPIIPLKVLLDIGSWSRISNGYLSDDDINEILKPWLEKRLIE